MLKRDLRLSVLRRDFGYVVAAIGGLVTLFSLFRPWIAARGADGSARATPFGRIDATTNFLNLWSQTKPPVPTFAGVWAIFATAAIVVTVSVVVANLRVRSALLARIAAYSTLASCVFVLLALVHVNSKGPQLKAMVGRSGDLGGQIGSLMHWMIGDGKLVLPGIRQTAYASAGLTHWAMLACAVSIGSAVAVFVQGLRDGTLYGVRRPWRLRSPLVRPDLGRAHTD